MLFYIRWHIKDRTLDTILILHFFLPRAFAHFIRAVSPICTASSIGALSLYNNGECTNRWRDKSRESVGGKGRKSEWEGRRKRKWEKERRRKREIEPDASWALHYRYIYARTSLFNRYGYIYKLHGRNEQADLPCCYSYEMSVLACFLPVNARCFELLKDNCT